MRLIDADKLKEDLTRFYDGEVTARQLIDAQPTAEPQTGKWINGKCNRCGEHAPFWSMASTYHCSNFCPNCGCKMEVDNEPKAL